MTTPLNQPENSVATIEAPLDPNRPEGVEGLNYDFALARQQAQARQASVVVDKATVGVSDQVHLVQGFAW